ncbi:MAG: MBL fold metallo-hydrolase [Polaromonas sp.]|jgi:glyoxylase-like metal-dependent hydrolase (beta-lactamase superfamily II)
MNSRITTQAFFDPGTWTVTYVVSCNTDRHAAIIDPVLDYDFKSGNTSTVSADRVVAYLTAHGLTVDWILETHAHADHVSGAHYLKEKVGGRIAIGENIRAVQSSFKAVFNLGDDFSTNGGQFDHLFKDGEIFKIGGVEATAMLVPGHTPADMAYRIEDSVFVGDTLFMPDVGTARADFPGGDAHALYRSIHKVLALPPATKLFVCHDYPPASRQAQWQTTVGEQRAKNIHVHDGITEAQFVAMRAARDATLEMPTLIIPAIQLNVRAGEMPAPEANGIRYLKVPLNALGAKAR